MATDAPLTGPDLTTGIAASSLEPGHTLLGHARGEAVLLARIGDSFTAIGATCPHYGGPLAEGLVVGDTVRCPWHHACFSLRTGEALRAPALTPVACWRVERRDDRVWVTDKVERGPLGSTYPTAQRALAPGAIAIIGAGAAGSAAAEMLRRCGFSGTLTLVDCEPASPYDRPNLSKDYLAGSAPEEWISLPNSGAYAEHGIDVIRARVTAIDVPGRSLELEGHAPVQWEALLLATGAEPIVLDLPGVEGPNVYYLRSLADSRSIIEAAKHAKTACVIGGSFIGLEVAASLRARGVAVHVVAPEALPLARVLGDRLGTFIKSLHEEKGVVFHLGRKPASIEPNAVVLDDGSRVECDMVVIGVGVRPRLALAEAAGLVLDRGVAVNEFLETSAPGIYAAGDIARWPDRHTGEPIRVEHWVVAQRMGQHAARNMLGAREPFTEAPFFWSAHYDVSVSYVGHAEQWDAIRVDGDADQRDVAVRYMAGEKVLALATIFRDRESLETEVAFEAEMQSPGR
jgi:NADPH-dependent 2,4-dienoyl-CoA reductase/sulfur reductase-like enzyme/nitrite reductase/ring-hydroxylating ferredoxin subunit